MFVARPTLRAGLLAAAPLAVAALAVWWDGGYSAGSRLAFGLVAVAVAGVALAVEPPAVRALAREPVVLVLLALGAAGALSALWTLGPVEDTLRWALVTAGYAGVVVTAAAAARRRGGVEALAAGIALLAVAAAAAGLVAAVVQHGPYAERIAGVWRPGGPFEYPPALALLQVAALPALLAGMTGRSRAVAALAAPGMALAGAVLALSASRVSLAMAVAVGGIAIAFAGSTARAGRPTVAAALGVGVLAAVALQLAAGAATPARERGIQAAGIVTLIAVAVLAGPLWLGARRALASRATEPRPPRPRALLAAVLAAALLAGMFAYGGAAGRGDGPASGILHGRTDTWRAAVETFADDPLKGTGADAFLAGSARHQGGQTILFAHDLPLELAAELGAAGLVLAVALYAATARLLVRARALRAGWLLGPGAAAFLIAGLVDWPWHLSGAGAAWSIAVGGLAGAARPTAKLLHRAPAGRTRRGAITA